MMRIGADIGGAFTGMPAPAARRRALRLLPSSRACRGTGKGVVREAAEAMPGARRENVLGRKGRWRLRLLRMDGLGGCDEDAFANRAAP